MLQVLTLKPQTASCSSQVSNLDGRAPIAAETRAKWRAPDDKAAANRVQMTEKRTS